MSLVSTLLNEATTLNGAQMPTVLRRCVEICLRGEPLCSFTRRELEALADFRLINELEHLIARKVTNRLLD